MQHFFRGGNQVDDSHWSTSKTRHLVNGPMRKQRAQWGDIWIHWPRPFFSFLFHSIYSFFFIVWFALFASAVRARHALVTQRKYLFNFNQVKWISRPFHHKVVHLPFTKKKIRALNFDFDNCRSSPTGGTLSYFNWILIGVPRICWNFSHGFVPSFGASLKDFLLRPLSIYFGASTTAICRTVLFDWPASPMVYSDLFGVKRRLIEQSKGYRTVCRMMRFN